MPDVDIVRDKVTRKFQRAYEKLCKGDLSPEDLSDVIAKALRNTLKDEGRVPCELIYKALTCAFNSGDSGKTLDMDATYCLVDHFASTSEARSRYLAIAVDALRAVFMQVENLDDFDAFKNSEANEYVRRVLDADFLDRMPLTGHQFNASSDDIERRLQAIRIRFESEVDLYVKQIARRETTLGVRKKPRKRALLTDFHDVDLSNSNIEDNGGS